MKRQTLVSVVAACVVSMFAVPARSDLIDVSVLGIPFKMTTPDEATTANNHFNNATGWIDEDSDTYMTAIVNSTRTVGIALNPVSAGTQEATYFGGVFSCTYLGYVWDPTPDYGTTSTYGDNVSGGVSPPKAGSEVTGAFYGLQFADLEPVSGIADIHADSTGLLNITFAADATEAKFNVYFTGGHFALYVDDGPGTAFPNSPISLGDVDLKDPSSTTNAGWNAATDGSLLLSGDFVASAETGYAYSYNGQAYTAMAVIHVTGLNTLNPQMTKDNTDTKLYPAVFETTGGALSGCVNPFDNPDSTEDVIFDGTVKVSDMWLTNYSLPKTPVPTGWVGDAAGSTFADATAQLESANVEYQDDAQVRMQLQNPEASAMLFMAPAFFGFVGYAVRRRRGSK